MNVRLRLITWTTAAALIVVPGTALAAVDSFIWFDGVPGEAKDPAHKGWFEIKDFSFGVENPATIGSATGGAGSGKVKFNEFTVKKMTDKASPVLQQALATGRHFRTVKIQMRKAGGDPNQFTSYEFNDVAVTKAAWSGPGNEGPEESITFVYGKMDTRYVSQQPVERPPPNSRALSVPPPAASQPHP